MPHYLLQVGYTPEAWTAMSKHPQSRAEQVRAPIEAMGGKLESCYLCFGEYDLIAVVEFPNNQTAAAFSIAASAGGAVLAYNTTPLLTMEEGIEAMHKAACSTYHPPA